MLSDGWNAMSLKLLLVPFKIFSLQSSLPFPKKIMHDMLEHRLAESSYPR